MRLIDADALKGYFGELRAEFNCFDDTERTMYTTCSMVISKLNDAPTVCCETCKHGIKGERIGDREYFSCVKPHADMSNYHLKDWVCGDWKDKNAVD